VNDKSEPYQSTGQDEALTNYMVMTDSNNIEEAIQLLEENHWDVTAAVNAFMNKQKQSFTPAQEYIPPPQPTQHQTLVSSPMDFGDQFAYGQPYYQPRNDEFFTNVRNNSGANHQVLQDEWDDGPAITDVISTKLSNGVNAAGSAIKKAWSFVPTFIRGCNPGGEEFLNEFGKKYKKVDKPKFTLGTFNEVREMSKQQKKLIFLYIHNSKVPATEKFVKEVLSNSLIVQLIDVNYIPFGLDYNTKEGLNVSGVIEMKEAPYVAVIRINESDVPVVMANMEGEDITVETLAPFLEENFTTFETQKEEEKKDNERKRSINAIDAAEFIRQNFINVPNAFAEQSSVFADEQALSRNDHARLMREIQQQEYDEALQQDMEKLNKSKKEEEKKLQIKKEEEEKAKSKERRVEEALLRLNEEPPATDKTAATIIFRMPQTGERVTRRFAKTDKIQALYDFIDSTNVQFENENNTYDLIQNIPLKYFNNKEKTIEEEGLHPKALLQIKEH